MRLLVINAVHDATFAHLRRQHPGKVLLRPIVAGRPLPSPGGRLILSSEQLKADVIDHLELLVTIGNTRVVEMGARQQAVNFDEIRTRLKLPLRVRGIPQDVVQLDEVQTFSSSVPEAIPPILTPTPEPTISARVPSDEDVEAARARVLSWSAEERDTKMARNADGDLGWWISTESGNVFVRSLSEPAPVEEKTPETLGEAILGHLQENDLTIMGGSIARRVLPITEIPSDSAVLTPPAPGSVEPVLSALGAEPPPAPPAPVATAEAWVRPDDLDELLASAKGEPLRSVLAVFGRSGAGKSKAVMAVMCVDCFASPDPVAGLKALTILRDAAAKE